MMETAQVPLFKLFVYSVVDVKDEFEEVNGLKMLFYLSLAWSFLLEAIFVLKFHPLILVHRVNACPHSNFFFIGESFCFWWRKF